ncbi:hypothetical protein TBLA_0E02320 [Henningerozyma blattae CBS 6284]|uniref:Dolichyl-phosphate-mannose--protein mannosyltransferase n=1 Tax=Henningerozyma blattae (strain ATCC 34711 / CBS 6284 / DSM 70876 / NBRC 10599 / NRRL Y-10934 / UCD 77-7) TaxID=1071380 RepID=I2H4I3_HENB6|nr:hypothetical protein TBLA_0E02320 [Tetrapisispora blattae CBS 6284]CCH61285.1 hypothetical protein TBLA_0E02320 [Tetrapisispora blattae CBS 6284]
MAATSKDPALEKEKTPQTLDTTGSNPSDTIDSPKDLSSKSASKSANKSVNNTLPWDTIESIVSPILLTLLACSVRMKDINKNKVSTWDEAHFGKFGSYYLRHEFYHDVHPPLGKMLVGLSGYIWGYNGSWDFLGAQPFPENVPYVKMRLFQALLSALCVPLSYFTAKGLKFSLPSVWLLSLTVLYENSYTTLAHFVLLDSILMFFTTLSFMCFVYYYQQGAHPFSKAWWGWMAATGISIGCTISVKMVGLFMVSVVGIHAVVDLWNLLGNKRVSRIQWFYHLGARILCLIVLPFSVFALSFKIHFDLLYKSGTGDKVMPSLFQASLENTTVGQGPRDIYKESSIITLRNMGITTQSVFLHSHPQRLPVGSKQQQVTGYTFADDNNKWYFQNPIMDDDAYLNYNINFPPQDTDFILNNMTYSLAHLNTGATLHSHNLESPVDRLAYEVTGYIGDRNDNWQVEILKQESAEEDTSVVHTMTTIFRLKHSINGCYLAFTGNNLPEWGFKQQEIACIKDSSKNNKYTWWMIEDHENPDAPPKPKDFKYPKPGFWSMFFYLNRAMMATNNALKPETDKLDPLSSRAWQWPTLNKGLRLNGWDENGNRYYLMGTPLTTWSSSLSIIGFSIFILFRFIRWQRQCDSKLLFPHDMHQVIIAGVYPLIGWALHFFPFACMGRVTYVHHYLPALYFALILLSFIFEFSLKGLGANKSTNLIRLVIYSTFALLTLLCFSFFSQMSYGMTGPLENYNSMNWLKDWKIGQDNYTIF